MATEPSKRPRGRPKTFDRDRTLQIAVDSYWCDGVDGVSVNEICRRAKISKPGLYREFGSEDQLLDAVLTQYSEAVLGPRMAVFSEDRTFHATLDSVINFATLPATSDKPAGCLFAKMRTVRGRLGPVTGEHVDLLRDQLIAVYSTWLTRSVERGEVTLPASVETTAGYVDAQMTLVLSRIAAGEDPEQVRAHANLAFSILAAPTAKPVG